MNARITQTLTVGAGTLVSRLLGVVRDAAIAWLLGGSGTADALTAALRIPYMVRRLFGEGALSMTLTVACIRESLRSGGRTGQARELALAVTRRVGVWGGLLTVLLVLGAGAVMTLTAPGLKEQAGVLEEAVLLFRICIPYVFFVLLAAGNMAALHSHEQFLLPSLTPALFNVTMLFFAGCAVFASEAHVGMLLACGVLCGGLLQWLAQIPAIRTEQRAERGSCAVTSEQVSAVMRRVPAGIFGAAVPQLAFLIASTLASLLPEGHMSALFYAERLLEFPLGILGAAVGMVSAPRMAMLAAGTPEDAGGVKGSQLSRETGLTVLLALGLNLPAAAGLIAVAVPLVALVLGHGAFDADAATRTSLALCAYAPGLPAYALSRPLLAACHAVEDNRTPLRAAVPSLVLTALAGGLLLQLPGEWGSLGPPLGVTIGLWCNAVLLWRGLHRSVPFEVPVRALIWQIMGAGCTFAVARLVLTLCAERGLSDLVGLALSVPLGALTYGVIWSVQWAVARCMVVR